MNDDDLVRSALRTLELLEELNRYEVATLAELQASIGLPKSTIARLLHTLIHAGYVSRVSRGEGYVITERVLRLADGFRHTDLVVAVARGHLDAFTVEHKWMVGLQTFDRGSMRTRYTTRDRSPLNADPTLINRRWPMLITAHGQVYLAFCPVAEREMILTMLKASKNPDNELARNPKTVEAVLNQVRRQGYAQRARITSDRVVGFAVPVIAEGVVVATIGMRYFATAMSSDVAVKRYLGPLEKLAASISAALVRLDSKRRSAPAL